MQAPPRHGRGNAALWHGDCLELLPQVANGSVDLVCADLPYGVTANKWDTPIDLAALWAQLLRVGKRNAAFVFTATQPFATALINSQLKLFRYDLVWNKSRATGHMNAKFRPMAAHEAIIVFSRASSNPMSKLRITYNPQMVLGKAFTRADVGAEGVVNYGSGLDKRVGKTRSNAGTRYPTSKLEFANPNNGNVHPTQKPVALLEWLVKTYSNPGDTVLDPTAGSFTTGVACVQTGRSFIGIEKDAGYFDIGKRRVEAAQPPLPGAA